MVTTKTQCKHLWLVTAYPISCYLKIGIRSFFSKPLFTQKEKLNLKTYNSTLLDIYRISVGEKLKKH